MGFFGNLFRSGVAAKFEMGSRIQGLKQAHEEMQSMTDEQLFEIVRKGRLYANGSSQQMKMAMAEKLLQEKGYSDKQIKQQTEA